MINVVRMMRSKLAKIDLVQENILFFTNENSRNFYCEFKAIWSKTFCFQTVEMFCCAFCMLQKSLDIRYF